MDKKEIVAQLIKDGAQPVKNLKVKNVNVAVMDNYTRLALTLTTPVKGMVSEDGIEYHEGETNVIFVSMYSITSLLKDNDDAAFAVNHLLKHPDSMSVVLSRATIDILQQTVAKDTPYRNPWSDSGETTEFDHQVIINHITDIKLSDFAVRKLDRLADNLLGF